MIYFLFWMGLAFADLIFEEPYYQKILPSIEWLVNNIASDPKKVNNKA